MLAPLVKHGLPVVDIHSWQKLDQLPVTDSISPDNSVFGRLLDHLFGELGYANPVLVSLPPKENITRRKKLEIFTQSLGRYGIPYAPERNIVFINKHSIFEAKRVYPAIFKANPEVDSIVCLSDTVAVTISVELAAEGRKIAVSGYDNLDISELFGITTIDQNLSETGRIAMRHAAPGPR
jgi:DNA-binding LacI/PurR family transcriptional regulator